MSTPAIVIGDTVEVIDTKIYPHIMRGKLVELDSHPFGDCFGLVELDSPALPPPRVWVNLRLAKKVAP